MARGSAYVLCLDDDVSPHRDLLHDMVAALSADPACFLATGYPVDIPDAGAGLMSYCMLAYHLPLIIAFSLGARAVNVWGGCMLLPVAPLLHGDYGFLSVRSCRSCTALHAAAGGAPPALPDLTSIL